MREKARRRNGARVYDRERRASARKKENRALAYAEELYTVFIKASKLFKERLN